jgi:hypothetical protein
MSNDVYLVSWCDNGLEYLVNLTRREKEDLFNVLSDKGSKYKYWLQRTVTSLTIQASRNPQQLYEIYTFRIDDSISEDSLRKEFTDNPQSMFTFIREHGVKI